MRKADLLLFLSLICLLVLFPVIYAADETLTITTYYPSPYGSYNELSSASNTNLATDGGSVGIGTTSPGTAKLAVIGGNVGIGTTNPGTKLEIYDTSGTGGSLVDVLTLTSYPSGIASQNAASLLFKTRSNDGSKNIVRIYAPLTDGTVGAQKGDLVFQTASSGTLANRVIIKDTGNVGIGTTGPNDRLEVRDNSPTADSVIYINSDVLNGGVAGYGSAYAAPYAHLANRFGVFSNGNTASGGLDIRADGSAHDMRFYTGGTATTNERVRITSTGNVGIGTTDFTTSNGNVGKILKIGSSNNNIVVAESSTANRYLILEGRYTSRTGGARSAQISIGDDGSNNGEIVFHTAPSGSDVSEVMRMKNGNVGIGTVSPVASARLHIYGGNLRLEYSATGKYGFVTSQDNMHICGNVYYDSGGWKAIAAGKSSVFQTNTGASQAFLVSADDTIRVADASTPLPQIFYVTTTGTVAGVYGTYHTSSDLRLKKDISTIDNPLAKLTKLRGVYYYWKDPKKNLKGDTERRTGLIAQEVREVIPEAVHIADDEMKTEAVNAENLIGLLIEGMKEQQKKIEKLEQEIRSGYRREK